MDSRCRLKKYWMLVPGNLGLQSLLFLLGWVAFLIIRHRWRNALAKKEEIMRLVAMASEEAAVAEVEATVKLSVTPVDREYQCAVCYCPTTMRCSQCKNVRYCSGKCQIIHWRRGHKDECYNPKATMLLNEGHNLGKKAMLQRQFGTSGDDFLMARKSKTSSEAVSWTTTNDDDFDKPLVDCKGSDTEFSSSKDSFSSDNTSAGCKIESIDVPSTKVLGADTNDHSKKSLARENNLHRPISRGSPVELDGNTSLCSKPTNFANPVDGICSGNKQARRISNYAEEEFDFQAQPSKVKMATPNDVRVASLGKKKPSREVALMESLDAKMSSSSQGASLSCLRADPSPGTGANSSQLFNHKEFRSLSYHSSREHQSLTGGNLVCKTKSQNGYHNMPTKCSGNASPISNVNNLKTSVQRVVQQFKVSKPLKSSQHGLNSDLGGRYNCKLIFPYERFVELYFYDKLDLQPFGLTNCGNSCYANSVLQCLAFTRPLTSYLLQGMHSKKCRKIEWCFICEFEFLILKAREGMSPISPMGILSKTHKIGSHLGHGRQEDAHEFLRYAVDAMQFVCLKEAGVKGSSAEETTLIGLTFGGHLLSKIKCLKCHGKSERCERMMDLTVEIGGDIRTLEEALAQFTASEILDQSNMYHCSRCKSYERAQKKLTILDAPNILTIVLKRFQSGNFEKLNKSIKFPEILNMAPYISGSNDDSPLYSLYGVVVHSDVMNATYSGHYVCYIQNFEGQWFKIDDSMVEPVALERVLSQGAYMLLYARRSPKAPSMVRSSIVSNSGKSKERNLEAVPSSKSNSKSRYSVVPKTDASVALQKPGKFAYWTTCDGYTNKQSFDPDDWRSRSVHSGDSSSENSSIFSFSDVSSCSTSSTKDSVTTEDLSDYIFGEVGSNCYNHYGTPLNSVASSSGPSCDANLKWEGEGERISRILYTDTSRHQRRPTAHFDSCNNGRSSSRPSEFDNFVYANPLISRLGSSFRTREESAQIYF